MKIFEFIDKYCQDIIKEAVAPVDMFDLDDLPNEGYMWDLFHEKRIPFIWVDDTKVPIADILSSSIDDFVRQYNNLPSARERYEHYIEIVGLIEGEEVIERIRKQVTRSLKKLNEDVANIIEAV